METKADIFSKAEQKFLKWIQIILLSICVGVLIYLIFFDNHKSQIINKYIALVVIEICLLSVAQIFFRRKHFRISSRLLVLAGAVGPWGSAMIDPSVVQGNLFPLVYLTIPILFSSFFTAPVITIVVGTIQLTGLTLFFLLNNIELSGGTSSLFFFIIFIFASSLIYNFQNRGHRRLISKQVQELNELAIHDPLTGLYNRHFLNEFMKKEFVRLERYEGKLSIIIFDIDDFKKYNDMFGHECGDSILGELSKVLIENFRESDIICRFGGDEFFIAMSNCGSKEAYVKCQELQKLVADRKLSCSIQVKDAVTLSIGIASFPEDGKSAKELIKAADNALYQAKKQGKDQIVIANA